MFSRKKSQRKTNLRVRPRLRRRCAVEALETRELLSTAQPNTLFSDNFQSSPVNTWPSGWIADAGAVSDPSENKVVANPSDPNSQVLQLHGVPDWSALAFHQVTLPSDFTVEARVRATQPGWAGPTIGIYAGPDWTDPARQFVRFDPSGITAGGEDGKSMSPGAWQAGQWYDVKMEYTSYAGTVFETFWINGTEEGQGQFPASSYEGSLDYLMVQSGDTTADWGDISVKTCAPTETSTATRIAASANPSAYGLPVTFTATVNTTPAGGTPSGSVLFEDGTSILGAGTLNANGVATLATSALAVGSHKITAIYEGDANDAESTSLPLTESVLCNCHVAHFFGKSCDELPRRDAYRQGRNDARRRCAQRQRSLRRWDDHSGHRHAQRQRSGQTDDFRAFTRQP